MSAKSWLAVLLGCWLIAGCTFNDTRKHCMRDPECDDGDRCFKGFCVAPRLSSSEIGGQGPSNRAGNGAGGRRAMDSGAGGRGSTTQDSGSGECNADAIRPCVASAEEAPALGGCGDGTQKCVNGMWGSCTPDIMMITNESCNGLDDDCDGTTDEDSDVQCFPENASGCVANEQGKFNCRGPCKAGTQRCVNGELQACVDAKVAAATDDCSTERIDENCDGTPNDKCQCTGTAMRDCGDMATDGVGICTAGKQQCVNGQWGQCEGAVTSRLELCNGDDDDCNGKIDDVAGLGGPCTVKDQKGVCAEGTFQCNRPNPLLQCRATAPNPTAETCDNKDNDCNGMIDDVLASLLQTDNNNCGACRKTCGATDKCCGGGCVNLNEDEKNCGACGTECTGTQMCVAGKCMNTQPPDAGVMCDTQRPCANGELCCDGKCVPNDLNNCNTCGMKCTGMAPACCSKGCADLATPDNCGKCDNACGAADGGVTCCPATTGPEMFMCRTGTTACQ